MLRPDDQLIGVLQLHHRLHGDALEMLRPGLLRDRCLDRLRRRAPPLRRSPRFNCTPPTSVLCVIVSEYSFSTTGIADLLAPP